MGEREEIDRLVKYFAPLHAMLREETKDPPMGTDEATRVEVTGECPRYHGDRSMAAFSCDTCGDPRSGPPGIVTVALIPGSKAALMMAIAEARIAEEVADEERAIAYDAALSAEEATSDMVMEYWTWLRRHREAVRATRLVTRAERLRRASMKEGERDG